MKKTLVLLIGLAFASGALVAAGAAYLAGRVPAPDGAPPSTGIPAPARANNVFVAQAMSALRAFEPPPAAARLSHLGRARDKRVPR